MHNTNHTTPHVAYQTRWSVQMICGLQKHRAKNITLPNRNVTSLAAASVCWSRCYDPWSWCWWLSRMASLVTVITGFLVKAPPGRCEIFAATAKPSLRILSWTGTYPATSGSPHTGAKKSRDVCETAAIYSLSLLARFLSLSPRIVEVSHSISESWHQLAIRMSFVGRLRRVGRDTFHSCVLFTHTSESACMCLVVSDFPHGVYWKINWISENIPNFIWLITRRLQKCEEEG